MSAPSVTIFFSSMHATHINVCECAYFHQKRSMNLMFRVLCPMLVLLQTSVKNWRRYWGRLNRFLLRWRLTTLLFGACVLWILCVFWKQFFFLFWEKYRRTLLHINEIKIRRAMNVLLYQIWIAHARTRIEKALMNIKVS